MAQHVGHFGRRPGRRCHGLVRLAMGGKIMWLEEGGESQKLPEEGEIP